MTGRTLSLKFECLMIGIWNSWSDRRHVAASGLKMSVVSRALQHLHTGGVMKYHVELASRDCLTIATNLIVLDEWP